MENYIPNISGFTDFCCFHASTGKSIYIVNHRIVASYDLLVDLKHRYNFTDENVHEDILDGIESNLYMFDVEKSTDFYYPRETIYHWDNSMDHIEGYVLRLKEKYC